VGRSRSVRSWHCKPGARHLSSPCWKP
jgi:hypothetical protein